MQPCNQRIAQERSTRRASRFSPIRTLNTATRNEFNRSPKAPGNPQAAERNTTFHDRLDRHHPGRHAAGIHLTGRVRGDAAPPPRPPPPAPDPLLLLRRLDRLVRHGPPENRRPAGAFSQRVRRIVHGGAVRPLGHRPHRRLRPARMGAAGTGAIPPDRAALPERRHLLHPGLRRHRPPHRRRPRRVGDRSRLRHRLHRRRHRLPARALPTVLPAGGACHPARRPRRLPAHRHHHAQPPRRGQRSGQAGRPLARMGNLGIGTIGKPSVLPDAGLLPVAARQPVLARRHHRRHGQLRPDPGRRARR